jgi:hypothetical protein
MNFPVWAVAGRDGRLAAKAASRAVRRVNDISALRESDAAAGIGAAAL